MKCNKCNKWAGAHATLPGQSTEHLCMCPPQRTWVGLTKDEMFEILKEIDPETQRLPIGFRMFADAIEAKLKEKNNIT